MSFEGDGDGGPREVDRFEGGVGWIARPEEKLQRASHALTEDGDVWLVDPVDAEGVDDLYADLGEVTGVVVALSRHTRDAATLANRHDVPVYVPAWMHRAVESDLQARVETFTDRLPGTDYRTIEVVNNRFWKEVALHDPDAGTLLVPEAVGTTDFFLAGDERLGVHPVLRAVPPRDALGGLDPDRVLVGHGAGVTDDAASALREALRGSRRRMPNLYAKNVRSLLPV